MLASLAPAGQASLMMLAVVGGLLARHAGPVRLRERTGRKGRHQRAADLAAVSAAQVMRDLYPRLFEPPFLEPDVPNPRHLEEASTALSPARPRYAARAGTACASGAVGRRAFPATGSRPRA